MAELVPVDHDPFAATAPAVAPAGVGLLPVDHDPFAAAPDRGAADAGFRHFAQGATFGLADELTGALGGAIDWAGLGPEGAKGTFSGGYDRTVANARAMDEAGAAAHPIASAIGEVGGGVATLPLTGSVNLIRVPGAIARTAPLLARIGNAAGRTAANIGNAAITGGAYSAANAAGSAEGGLGQRAVAGLEAIPAGMAVGAAFPPAGAASRGAGHLLGHPVDAVKALFNPEKAAASQFVDSAIRDTGSVGAAERKLRDLQSGGAPATAMDLGETSRGLARRSANLSPEARTELNAASDNRYETQFDRVSNVITRVAPGVNSPATREFLQQAGRAAKKPAYAKAYLEGDRPIWSPELERLAGSPDVINAMRDAVVKGKSRAIDEGFGAFNPGVKVTDDGQLVFSRGKSGVPTYPNLQFWDYTKRALDDAGRKLQRAGATDEAGVAFSLVKKLRGELDRMVPSYAKARGTAEAFFGADDALTAGEAFVHSPAGNAEARKALMSMKPVERQLFAEGYATKVLGDLAKVPDRNTIVNRIFNSPAARERFEIALGPQAAKEMESAIRVETVMDLGRKALQGNSTTARQLIESGIVGTGVGVYAGGADPFNPATWLNPTTLITGLLTAGAVRGGRAGINNINAEVANRVAKMLTSQDPAIVRKAFKLIGSNPPMMTALRRGQDRLARVVIPALPHPGGGGLPALASGPLPANANDGQQDPRQLQ